jgi:photosystem II stability/assembly factor-like uncharacterized protein
MKPIIFAAFLICLVATGRAQLNQQTQQTDSTPSPWVRANTPMPGAAGANYLSLDTCWGGDIAETLLSTDGGMNWHSVPGPVDGIIMAMRNAHEGYMFSTHQTWVYKTSNAWQTWDSVPCPMLVTAAVIVDSLHAFTAGSDRIGRTTDGGKTWTSQAVASPGLYAIAFANGNVGYAAGNGVFKTSDGGNTWNATQGPIPSEVSGIAVIDPLTVAAVTGAMIYRTIDSGATWQKISHPDSNTQTQGLEGIVIKGGQGIIAGAPGLILSSEDTGKTWLIEPSGFTTGYLSIPIIYNDSLATVGGDDGILIRKFTNSAVSQSSQDSLIISIFPNPTQNQVTFQYNLPSVQLVTLAVFDAAGNLVANILQRILQNPGIITLPMSTTNFASGTYFFRLLSDNYSSTGSFIVIHA